MEPLSPHTLICSTYIIHSHTLLPKYIHLLPWWLLVMTIFIILPRECVLYVWVVTVQPGHGPRNQLAIPANTSSPHTAQYWITNIYCLQYSLSLRQHRQKNSNSKDKVIPREGQLQESQFFFIEENRNFIFKEIFLFPVNK